MPRRRPTNRAATSEAPSLATLIPEALSPGVIVVDAQKKIVCGSAEAERLLGLPAGQAAGSDLAALPAAVRKLIREVTATGRSVAGRVVALGAGKDVPSLRVSAHPFLMSDAMAGIVVIVSDAAVAQRLEQDLQRLDRLASVGTLSLGLTHEIRNALVGMRTFVELLLEKNRDAELAETVGRELKRIETLVSQMLRFRTPVRPTLSLVHVHDVLNQSLRMLQHQFETEQINVHREFGATCDAVKGDEYQLEQAFLNLFFNALEAMGTNGNLTVATENLSPGASGLSPRQFCVTVADDGIGILPEHRDRLFEPFFTTKQHGTGLGLAITRRIIREHHGDITAQSEPNCGTKLKVVLPVQTAKRSRKS